MPLDLAVALIVRPYIVSLIAHFVIFCLTMIALVLMLVISWWVVFFCEKILKLDPFAVRVLIVTSDLLIVGQFTLYLVRSLGL
jgi:hypothetical protein